MSDMSSDQIITVTNVLAVVTNLSGVARGRRLNKTDLVSDPEQQPYGHETKERYEDKCSDQHEVSVLMLANRPATGSA
jgi:hypothetical protein